MSPSPSRTKPLFVEPFCSYCGSPPSVSATRQPPRICERCKLGMVLYAPAAAAPGQGDPFVIVDQELKVKAISRGAERVLAVDEPAGVDVPVDEFLISANSDPARRQFARLVVLAASGAPPGDPLELQTVGNPPIRLEARISSCGPPLAALVVLAAPAPSRSQRSTNGKTAGRSRHSDESARSNGDGRTPRAGEGSQRNGHQTPARSTSRSGAQ